jgi:hypothetical protein
MKILKRLIFVLALLIALCIMMIRTDENLSRHESRNRCDSIEQNIASPAPSRRL